MSPAAHRSPHFSGVWAAVLLPLDIQGDIDRDGLAADVETLCRSGVDGLYTNGTAGEFHLIDEAEFDLVTDIVASICTERQMPFQIGLCDPNPRRALDRARRCRGIGAAGFQIILPDWFPVTDKEAISFLTGLATVAGDTPLVLYNPPHAKRRLSIAGLAQLADAVPSLAGLKLPGGDHSWYGDAQILFDRMSVFIPGHHMASGVLRGAHGSYSNMACLSPAATAAWWRLISSDPDEALRVEDMIRTFFAAHITPLIERDGISNFAVDKMLAAIGGWSTVSGSVRWPHDSVPQDMTEAVGRKARRDMRDFFDLAPDGLTGLR